MTTLFIVPAKKVIEIVSIVADFSDLLPAGDSLSSVEVAVTVFTGTDPTPEDVLYQSEEITGDICVQRIKAGLPGVVYLVLFTATTTLGNTLTMETRQAVLPNDTGAEPVTIPLYFTSLPYPVNTTEMYQSPSIYGITGSFNYQPYIGPESIRAALEIDEIQIYGSSVDYDIPFESIQATLEISEIQIYGTSVDYSIPFESINATLTVEEIQIYGDAVTYDIPFESIQATLTITSIEIV